MDILMAAIMMVMILEFKVRVKTFKSDTVVQVPQRA
jgi:hypothetical protein